MNLEFTHMWVCLAAPWQYAISDHENGTVFLVTAKQAPNLGKIIDLGTYYSYGDAVTAVQTHYSNNRLKALP